MLVDKMKDSQVGGIFAIIGGFILHLTLGTLYCFGNMNTYMTSYLRTHVEGQAREFFYCNFLHANCLLLFFFI